MIHGLLRISCVSSCYSTRKFLFCKEAVRQIRARSIFLSFDRALNEFPVISLSTPSTFIVCEFEALLSLWTVPPVFFLTSKLSRHFVGFIVFCSFVVFNISLNNIHVNIFFHFFIIFNVLSLNSFIFIYFSDYLYYFYCLHFLILRIYTFFLNWKQPHIANLLHNCYNSFVLS